MTYFAQVQWILEDSANKAPTRGYSVELILPHESYLDLNIIAYLSLLGT